MFDLFQEKKSLCTEEKTSLLVPFL